MGAIRALGNAGLLVSSAMAKQSPPVNEILDAPRGRRARAGSSARSLAQMIERAGRHDAWTATLRALLDDEIAPHVYVAALNIPVMTIYVSTAAWATRLRFDVPRLLEEIARLEDFRGITDIRLKAQPIPEVRPPTPRKIDRNTPPKELIEALADDTEDDDLRRALERLANVRGQTEAES